MKLSLKSLVLPTAMLLVSQLAIAAEDKNPKLEPLNSSELSYAFGVSFAKNFSDFLEQQKNLGVSIDKKQLVAGVQDALNNKVKMDDKKIESVLKSFQEHVAVEERQQQEKVFKERSDEAVKNKAAGDKYREEFAKQSGVVKTESGLLYRIDKKTDGETPKPSDKVKVNYKGTLIDGTVFDSSYERNQPIEFVLSEVIPGWKEGIGLMKKGEKATFVIPPELAYGDNFIPGIPGNSTLIFEVELLDILPQEEANTTNSPNK